ERGNPDAANKLVIHAFGLLDRHLRFGRHLAHRAGIGRLNQVGIARAPSTKCSGLPHPPTHILCDFACQPAYATIFPLEANSWAPAACIYNRSSCSALNLSP